MVRGTAAWLALRMDEKSVELMAEQTVAWMELQKVVQKALHSVATMAAPLVSH